MSVSNAETIATTSNTVSITFLPANQNSEASTVAEGSSGVDDTVNIKVSKPSTKTHRKLKDPEAPRRPLSAYMVFAKEERTKVLSEMGNLAMGDLGKEMGKRWGSLELQEKKKYVDAYTKDKARYDEEMKTYQPSKQFLDMKAKHDHDLAEKENSLHMEKYFTYVHSNWRKLSEESPGLGPKQLQEKAWVQWIKGGSALGYKKQKKTKKEVDPEAPKKPSNAFFLFQKKMRNGGLATTAKGLAEMWKSMDDDSKKAYKEEEDELKKKYLLDQEEYMEDKLAPSV